MKKQLARSISDFLYKSAKKSSISPKSFIGAKPLPRELQEIKSK
ncbi:hypothetical protein [Paenibacillus sp. YPG26]|nr:hypothetical protein [Paenibacillus sp. YPG26]